MKTCFHFLLISILWTSCAAAQKTRTVPPRKGESRNLKMFNGKSLDGWAADEAVWSIENAELIARGSADGKVKTQLITEVPFSDFRMTIEFQAQGAQAGIGFWKSANKTDGQNNSINGHVVQFAPQMAIALSGRTVQAGSKAGNAAIKTEDWNRLEILAQGNRIRAAVNGEIVADWLDPKPAEIETGPISINFAAESAEQHIRFRALRLETFPKIPKLATLGIDQRIAEAEIQPLDFDVDPNARDLWSSNSKIVIPDELLWPFIDAEHGLTTMGIRVEESNAFHAILEKARLANLRELRKAAREFVDIRRNAKGNEPYKDRDTKDFKTFVDLFGNPEAYHGKPVTLTGHIRKLIRIPAAENAYNISGYYEAWLYDPNSQKHPTVILATSLDKDLIKLQGADIEVDHVTATGYFVKNMGYQAQKQHRFAPLLIAQQIELVRRVKADPFALTESAKWILIVFACLLAFWTRFFWKMRARGKVEEAEREVVREIVERQQPEPSFDEVAAIDAAPNFSALGEVDSSQP